MIEIYPSKFDGEPIERHTLAEPTTVEAWLIATVSSYERRAAPPISLYLNGDYIPPSHWYRTPLGTRDTLSIYPEPKGAELIIAAVTIAAAATLVTSLLIPKPPKAQDSGSSTQGEDVGLSTAKGNKVKINSPIRELAGRHRIYPDYILPQRRYFRDQRDQWVDMMLCIGMGRFDLPTSRIKIGETPIAAFGDDVVLRIYQPGENVSADPCAVWWHSAEEVGATSTGTAGLDLRTVSSATPNAEFNSATFDGDDITIPAGAGSFPANWEAGMIVRIDVRYPYTVSDNTGTAGRDVVNGSISQLGLPNGAEVEIIGDNAGDYEVFSQTAGTLQLNYNGGTPAAGLKTGAVTMAIGYRGHRYRILTVAAQSMTVERLTDTGATDGSWPGFGLLVSTTAAISLDSSTGQVNWVGPFAACPDGKVTSSLEFDVFFPQGLFQINKYSNPVAFSVTVEFQYRNIATAGDWIAVQRTYNLSSIDQVGFTETINLAGTYRPECRMRRITPDSASAQVSDSVQWYGLRAKLQARTGYPGVSLMSLRIRSGNRLATQAEQLISAEPTRILPVRVDGEDIEQPTRSIAPWVRHVAHSVGYTDADLDLLELERLGVIWDARGDFYDFPHDGNTTVKTVMNNALQAGFAEITIDRGRIRPARDELREQDAFEHLYTPQNMAQALQRQFTAPNPDDFDGVDVEYVDGVTWNVETVRCRVNYSVAAARVRKMRADGITSRDRAWRIGMRQLLSDLYRRWAYSWGTELDALNSRYLSYVATADDVPGYGQSAIMTSIAGNLVGSSEPLDWSGGGPWVLAVRRPDGSLSGPYPVTRFNDRTLVLAEPLDFVPDLSGTIEPPHLLFGLSTRWTFPSLVTEITPNGTEAVSVKAINYDARVYANDDGTAPAEA